MSDIPPTTRFAYVSDLHSNSTISVCPPVVNLDDGGTYHASRGQRWLWDSWINMWDTIQRDYPDERKVLVINGDIGELDTKRRSYQLISGNKATILEIVRRSIEPAVELADSVYIIR